MRIQVAGGSPGPGAGGSSNRPYSVPSQSMCREGGSSAGCNRPPLPWRPSVLTPRMAAQGR
eukprot:4074068-Pyramimonas_sp.AAC.1